ncbi:MAG: diversity-generating retroelement protein Avd [Cyanobacteria bacterium REEB65]|nr:diversity-generating retroelement protein Avd [Cyanobacteria bacterium REEB65]
MAKELILLQKVEDMATYAYHCIEQFPKAYKFTLGEQLQHVILDLLSLIITCNKRYHKKTTLQEIDIRLDTLRSLVRMAKDLKILPFHKYEHWARLDDEIGRLLGGWIRSMAAGDAPSERSPGTKEEVLSS